MISEGFAPINFATLLLLSSTMSFALIPNLYSDDGFPQSSTKHLLIASITSLFGFVVAALSR